MNILNWANPGFIFYSVQTKQSKFHSNVGLDLHFWIHTWRRLATCTSYLLHIPIQGWFSQRHPACASLEQCQWPAYTCGHPSTAGTFCSLSLLAFHQRVSSLLLAALHSPHTAWYSGRYIWLKRQWINTGWGSTSSMFAVIYRWRDQHELTHILPANRAHGTLHKGEAREPSV